MQIVGTAAYNLAKAKGIVVDRKNMGDNKN
jgi:hypothetical protein